MWLAAKVHLTLLLWQLPTSDAVSYVLSHVSTLCPHTAGYGDDLNIMNSIHLLKQYVEHQNQRWLDMEMDKGRGVDLADVEDPRVDLCLFCIQAHRLRPVDLRCVSFCCHCLLVPRACPCLCQGHSPGVTTWCLFSIQAHRLCPVGLQCTTSAATALKSDRFICLLLLMPWA